jgi:hypothetical protein
VLRVVVSALVVVCVACARSGTPEHGGTEAPRPSTAGRPPEVAEAYVRLVTGSDDEPDLASVAATGSPARLYGLHLLATRAMTGPTEHAVERDGVDLRVCSRLAGAADAAVDCHTLGGFRIDEDGRLRTFSINGQPLGGRVTRGDRRGVTADGVTIVVETAVVSTRGDLVVVFAVTNNRLEPLRAVPERARYLPAYRPPVATPEDLVRDPTVIPPGVRLRTMALFEGSVFGGMLRFVGRTPDGAELDVEVAVPDPT